MDRATQLMLAGVALVTAGCNQSQPPPAAATTEAKSAPSTAPVAPSGKLDVAAVTQCVASAEYIGPQMGNDRNRVRIASSMGGGGFKYPAVAGDVESYGVDAAGTQSQIKPARTMLNTSGTQITAELQHMAAFDKTNVHVRCADGNWSNWVVAKK
ncbi:hypothetical protein [Phenylobacterium sp. RIFCSPHIGHO2_01_FULL_69_31]|uniref:hypothetical protein n=1 Tax=Phenylobacterium sp. RIFCSPHIGHO2_01_FULL_69_31 TaxID=1801944 RepID=UPI0025CC75DF|nr:hypothetical protein [Phenylobacterium sp. RIFCSPHIGHO2_01_FULL_69_31]